MNPEYFRNYYIEHRDLIRKQHALYYLTKKRQQKKCDNCGQVYLKNNEKYHKLKFCRKL